jgi:quinol-cytochrome oxidoreductase complex cytochrome b subunit
LHFRPTTVPERTVRFSLTWGLGGIAFVLVILLFGSGLMLKFVYEPTVSDAYESIRYLERQVPFGQLLRNLHRWSGYGLILAAFLHLLRVFYTGAYTSPRQLNWVIGLGLFALVVLSNFTGYLLPWDQIAYWAITISASMLEYVPLIGSGLKTAVLAGAEPGQGTLMNFYAIHTAILPLLIALLLPFHFWRIRKAGGLVIPRSPSETHLPDIPELPVMPHLFAREAGVALVTLLLVLLVSMVFNAPLADPANPGLSPNPTKAPWYFMGLQELLMHFHPVFAVLIVPLPVIAAILALPWIDPSTDQNGIWFRSARGRRLALFSVPVAALVTVAAIALDEFMIRTGGEAASSLLRNGALPFSVIAGTLLAYYLLVRTVFSASRSEAVLSLFTFVLTAFMVLTATGIWFRTTGMQLGWAGV